VEAPVVEKPPAFVEEVVVIPSDPVPPPPVPSAKEVFQSEFVRCKALRGVLAMGMPYFAGDEFTHHRDQAEAAVARGDLVILGPV
jgi:hypothetical protein